MYALPLSVKVFAPVAPPPPVDGADYGVWLDAERARIAEAMTEAENFLALMEERLAAEFAEIDAQAERRAQIDRNIDAINQAVADTTAEIEQWQQWSDRIETQYGDMA